MHRGRSFSYLFGVLFGTLFFLLSTHPLYAADPIFVKAGGAGDGSSWANAASLQGAISAATSGDEIWVATGIYTPGVSAGTSFVMPHGVALYGGFAGSETLLTERNWVANPTVLSGDIGGDDTTDANGVVTTTTNLVGTNSTHVLKAVGTSGAVNDSTRLDGFTVTAGTAGTSGSGGGFYCDGSGAGHTCSPHIENVIFSGNKANTGGAMYNNAMTNGTSSPTLVNVTFDGNSATNSGAGGALYNTGENNGVSSPSLTNVVFTRNSASGNGGAVFNDGRTFGVSNPTFVNVTFAGNAASSGGALYNLGVNEGISHPSITNGILWGNSAVTAGAEAYNFDAALILKNSLVQGGFNGPGIVNGTGGSVFDAGNNLDGDPLFVDQAAGNVRLSFGSPAIDSGDDDAIALATDRDGNPRKVNGDGLNSATVDMGAFEFQVRSLALATQNNGSGHIDRDPSGFDCDGCILYAPGTVVTLTATADTGSTFNGFSGDCSGSSPCELTMDTDKSVTADFSLNTYTLTVSTDGDGSGTVSKDPDQPTYSYGALATLTAVAEPGSSFSHWSGDCLDTETNPCQLTIDSEKSATATFILNSYPVTVTTSGDGSGTVSKDPDQPTYLFGAEVTLTASADTGSIFDGWSGDCSGLASCPLTITTSNQLTATFSLLTYPITVTKTGNGSGTIAKTPDQADYPFGSEVVLTATAAPGSTFAGWSGDCGGASSCHLTIDASNKVTATFTLNSYPITIHNTGNGTGTVSQEPDQPTYLFGATVDLSASAGSGSTFGGWGGDCSGTSTCHLTIGASNKVTATFTLNSYPITINNTGNGTGTVSQEPDQPTYLFGATVDLSASAGNGSTFSGWGGDCSGTSTCHLTIGASNKVTATFTLNSYTLTINTEGEGTVSKTPDQESYLHGTEVTLTASAGDGFTFAGWSGDCSNEIGDCHLTMTSAQSVTATFEEESGPGNHAPGIFSTPGLTATVGLPYTYEISALDPDLGDVLTISAPVKPDWLTLTQDDNNSATLSGVPEAGDVGENAVQLLVEDGGGASSSQSFTITVSITQTNTPTGTVQGTVLDQAGKGVPGAEVTLSDESGGQHSEIKRNEISVATLLTQVTDANGNYLFEGVPVGDYSLTVHIDGKKDYMVAVTVKTGQTTSVPDITLIPIKLKLMLPAVTANK